jgi:hypothetical protein
MSERFFIVGSMFQSRCFTVSRWSSAHFVGKWVEHVPRGCPSSPMDWQQTLAHGALGIERIPE